MPKRPCRMSSSGSTPSSTMLIGLIWIPTNFSPRSGPLISSPPGSLQWGRRRAAPRWDALPVRQSAQLSAGHVLDVPPGVPLGQERRDVDDPALAAVFDPIDVRAGLAFHQQVERRPLLVFPQ